MGSAVSTIEAASPRLITSLRQLYNISRKNATHYYIFTDNVTLLCSSPSCNGKTSRIGFGLFQQSDEWCDRK